MKYNQAVNLEKAGKSSESCLVYQDLLKSWPNYNKARYNLTLLQLRAKEYAQAEENLSYLKDQKPNNLSVCKLQAYLLILQGKEKEALTIYKDLILRVPLDVNILYNLAYLVWKLEKNKLISESYLRRLKFIQEEGLFKDKEWVKELERSY